MSNGIRWTSADLERYQQKTFAKVTEIIPKNIPVVKEKKITVDYPGMIVQALRVIGCVSTAYPKMREYKFLHDRRFKFDIAFPEYMLAIEYEGIHMQKNTKKKSRHQNGAGYAKDCKKYNLAVMHGWKLLRFTTADTGGDDWEFKVAGEIERFIKQQTGTQSDIIK